MTALGDTHIRNRRMVQPNHANSLGTVHGGNVMKWLDEVGALSAMRFAGETCVTVRMDRVEFHQPIPEGETCLIEAYVYDAGRTSVRVRLRAFREDPRTGETRETTESYSVYVAVDADGRPTPVPALEVDSAAERDLREAALAGERGDDDETGE